MYQQGTQSRFGQIDVDLLFFFLFLRYAINHSIAQIQTTIKGPISICFLFIIAI